ncbi:MAG TPA: D-glycero-beta-D-manno-heptose-7-phosphate kinase [Vicinamibacteria bacterium]|nr:D-glycero-beta-D-manno-heptose-7-phosphate kinase [Vicinamibacteria bacterium]
MTLLLPARAADLLEAMRGRRVLVLGDVMLDEFLWGRVSRISPEAPVPVVEVSRQSFHLGGAGNVAANVRSLGGEAALVCAVGDDAAGRLLREALQAAQVQPLLAVSDSGRPTTVKTRIVAHNQQVVRADREDARDLDSRAAATVLAAVRAELPRAQALVVSDYQKGVVTAALLRQVLPLARRRRVSVLVDPKLRHFRRYRGVTLVTPNAAETEQATGIRLRGEPDLLRAGRRILALLGCRAALITRGEQGMSLFERGRPPLHVKAAAREVFDVTGAGDTVIATLSLALAAGASLPEAAALANLAAGVVVGKVGTAQATPDEVLAAVRAAASTGRRRGAS